ncbi:baseplate J/gp47 family protein [Xenorhabdus bovienii]
MMWITPEFQQIRDDLLRDIKNQLSEADTGSDSDYFARASSVASVAEGIYQHQSWIVRQIFPDTADTDYLELHARTRNLIRKPTTTAKGTASLTGSPGAILPAGAEMRGETVSAKTTAAVTIDPYGQATVTIITHQSGTAGNRSSPADAELVSAPMGINSRVVVQTLTGGTDAETDASLLARLLDIIRRPPAGGNKYDYRRWALAIPGVTNAFVYPLRRGLGTVDIAITSADGLPSAETIKAVQAHIDDVRPVTARHSLVLAPTLRPVDFVIEVVLEGVTLEAANQEIKNVITDAIGRLAPGEPLIRSQIEMRISLIPGIRDRRMITPVENVVAQVDKNHLEWLRAGHVTVRLFTA